MDPKAAAAKGGGDQEIVYSKEQVSDMIRDRVKQQDRSHKTELDALRKELTPATPAPKVHTRAELQAAVKAGTITEAEGLSILDKQQSDTNQEQAQRVATQTVENMNKASETQASINKYLAFDESLSISGSDSKNRIETEIQAQMKNLGVTQSTLGIELNALRTIYGEEMALGGGERDRATHQEIPGGGSPLYKPDDSDGVPPDLSPTEKKFYQQRLDAGDSRYPEGWKSVDKELKKFSSSAVRQRAVARG